MLPGLGFHHTREGFVDRRLEAHVANVDDFTEHSENGLWLLPGHLSQLDLEVGAKVLADRAGNTPIASERERLLKSGRVLARSTVTLEGCYEGGLRGKQTPARMLIQLAELELGTLVIQSEEEVDDHCICGNPHCYNARHFTLTYVSEKNPDRIDNVNPDWFMEASDGTLRTIWGDDIPGIEDSLRMFIEFQRANYPYVDISESYLTVKPISQIQFNPFTGCWEATRSRIDKIEGTSIRARYGSIYRRYLKEEMIDADTGEIISFDRRRGSEQAHVMTWNFFNGSRQIGRHLNHMCFNTMCCNPLHLEEVAPAYNSHHATIARQAIENHNLNNGQTALPNELISEQKAEVRRLYSTLDKEVDQAA